MSKKIVLCHHSSKPSLASSTPETIATNVDLLTEILLRVPAISLIRFKSVSKQWLSLISDSRFARDHTQQNPSPPPSGLYFYSNHNRSLPLNDQIARVSVRDHQRTTLPGFSFLDDSGSGSGAKVHHSSNGLMLCTIGHFFDYVVCNLTTQKYVLLPTLTDLSESYISPVVGSYLVFDPKKSPYYKVVVVSSSYDWDTSNFFVYSSESGSWNSTVITPRMHQWVVGRGAVWNGAVILMSCWTDNGMESCAKHDHSYYRFDIDAEKLTTTRVPAPGTNLSKWNLYFGECEGHLLLIQMPQYNSTKFRVLEMMDGENNFQWTVKYVVDVTPLIFPRIRNCKFVVVSVVNVGAKENDLAVVLYIRGQVMLYNIKCKTLKVLCDLPRSELAIWVAHTYNYSYEYIESLTPV